MFLISIYQWKGPKNVGDVKKTLTFINLCFVTIENKDIFIQGEIHWHSLQVFRGHMAMQKVIFHLVIYIR